MFRFIGLVMAASWCFAGWRNLPPVSNHYSGAFGFIFATSVLLAYYAGTRRKRDAAVAVAVARAEAKALASVQATTTSQANVVVINDTAYGARRAGAALGLEDAPWLAGAKLQPELEMTDAVESMIEDVDREAYEERA